MSHHMTEWETAPMPNGVLGRKCEHGLLHPDPEDLTLKAKKNFALNLQLSEHECDGCCVDLGQHQREEQEIRDQDRERRGG